MNVMTTTHRAVNVIDTRIAAFAQMPSASKRGSPWLSGQVALVAALTAATGWCVGVSKLTQVLMTMEGARFETASEQRAELFLVSFGLSKAVGNLVAGGCADTYGRRPAMLLGWCLAVPMALLVLCARSWSVVVWADVLLGLNQALCWSTAIFLAVDLLGPSRRSAAIGLIETSGYTAIALASPLVSATERAGGEAAIDLHNLALLVLAVGCAALSVYPLRETAGKVLAEEEAGGGGGGEVRAYAPRAARGVCVHPSHTQVGDVSAPASAASILRSSRSCVT